MCMLSCCLTQNELLSIVLRALSQILWIRFMLWIAGDERRRRRILATPVGGAPFNSNESQQTSSQTEIMDKQMNGSYYFKR